MPWSEGIEAFWGRYWPVIGIAGFFLGFILAYFFWRKKTKAHKAELDDIREGLQNSEKRISQQLSSWVQPDEDPGRAILRTGPVDMSDSQETGIADSGEGPEGHWVSRVRITKVQGKEDSPFKIGESLVGYDERLPEVGKTYRLLIRDGKIFATSEVTKVDSGLIHTRNSVYRIEFLEREKAEDET